MTDEEKEAHCKAQYEHIKELGQLKYEQEEKRESSLVTQSSQMQTAFSFVTAAVFMAVPVCVQYRGGLPLSFFFISCAVISLLILASLILASLAQWRFKNASFSDISEIERAVVDDKNWEQYSNESFKLKQWVQMLSVVQKKKSDLNNRRVKLIMSSMICFYCSIATIVVSFICATIFL